LETSPHFRIPNEISTNKSLTRRERDALTAPHPVLTQLELICNLFFTVDFCLRFLTTPDKRAFVTNPYHFLEFLAISPIFFPSETLNNKQSFGVKIHNYIEVFYILRVLRIFLLVPKSSGLRVLLLTLKKSIGELILYVLMLLMTIMLFASFIFYAEQIYETDDNKFDSILIGLWWAIVTMTTLGYGDYVPVTPIGYIVGGLCAISGLIFMSLPVPLIVNNFTTFYAHAKARQKLKEYTDMQKYLPQRAIALRFQAIESRFIKSNDDEPNLNYCRFKVSCFS
jgi:potassium voltage-gated channel Shaw-related subfamily C protein 1